MLEAILQIYMRAIEQLVHSHWGWRIKMNEYGK